MAVDLTPTTEPQERAGEQQPSGIDPGTLNAGGQSTRNSNSKRTLASGKSIPLEDQACEVEADQHTLPQVPGYEVTECLGQGNMGAVYRAREIKLNRQVALKFIELGPRPKAEEVLRFQIEAESLASVQHAGVVQVYEAGSHENQLFLAMELVEGSTLENHLEQKHFTPSAAATMAYKLARAVQALHGRGIVHRDLKPANILLDRQQEPKLADFGLAKRVEQDSQLTQAGMIVGTPCYMAPEQAAGESRSVGPAADVFSLGVILYELLTGHQPFVGDTVLSTLELIRHEEAVPPARIVKGVPRDLETICLKCLHKDAKGRYATAGELADDLQRYLRGEPVTARALPLWERAWKWSRRHPALAVGSMLLACSLALGAMGGAWHHAQMRAERDATHEYFQLSEEAVRVLLAEVADQPAIATPHFAQKREAILETALAYYQQLGNKHQQADADLKDIATTHIRQADCLRWLNRYDQASDLYQQAIALLNTAPVGDFLSQSITQPLASAYTGTGQVHLRQQQLAEAEHALQQAINLHKQLAREFPAKSSYLAELANNYNQLAECFRSSNLPKQARAQVQIAIELLESLVSRENTHHRYVQDLAESHLTLGTLLHDLEQHERVETSYRRALDLFEHLHAQQPTNPEYHAQVSRAATHLGEYYQAQGDLPAAHNHLQRAHAKLSELSAMHGQSDQVQTQLATAQARLEQVTREQGN